MMQTPIYSRDELGKQQQKIDELHEKLVKILRVKQQQLDRARQLKKKLDTELQRMQAAFAAKPCRHAFSFEKKYAYALTTIVGRRPSNEDAHIVSEACLAILDGHGGSECSKAAAQLLEGQLQHGETGDVRTDLKLAILALDYKLSDYKDAGCTLGCVVMQGQKLYLITCGDTRIITERHATQDHKPSLESEQQRIYQYGGLVMNGRVNAQLAVSRALGDFQFKVSGVVAQADVLEIEAESWILLGCDGLFDVIDNDQAREAIKCIRAQKFTSQDAAVQMVLNCYQGSEKQQQWEFSRWKTEEERISQAFVKAAYLLESTDNISVIFCQRR